MSRERQPFPLVPRRRLAGLPFGELPSRRRGQGADVIGSRPYEPRDPVSTIEQTNRKVPITSSVSSGRQTAALPLVLKGMFGLSRTRRG